MTEEMFEDLAYDTIQDYVGETLVSEENWPYKLENVTRRSYDTVEYRMVGFPVAMVSRIGDLVNLLGNDYGRAQARGLTKEQND